MKHISTYNLIDNNSIQWEIQNVQFIISIIFP